VYSLHVSLSPWFSGLVLAYTTVFLAELIGDKTIYTIAALTLKFPRWPIFIGIALGFAGKMLAAVLFAKVLLKVPGHWPGILSAAGFFSCAVFIWLKEPKQPLRPAAEGRGWLYAASLSLSSLFFTEWCDAGQIASAALAARTQMLFLVWLGGTLALLTKGILAMTVGAKLSGVIPIRFIRAVAFVSYCVLGILSLSEVLGSLF
jgi:putative Ca2+/H+ antiporter (TMEM165/GDT1 family)